MKILKTFFSSFRNAALSVVCAILVLAAVGTGLALAVQAGERKPLMDRNAATEYALKDAGLELSEITITKQKLDRESGNEHYEIEFYTDSYAYEYEINASTGAVLGVDIKALFKTPVAAGEGAVQPGGRQTASDSQGNPESSQPAVNDRQNDQQPAQEGQENQPQQPAQGGQEPRQSSDISLDKAKEIALKDASLTSAEGVTFTKAKQDLEDGIRVYDLEFIVSNVKYEYEIDAATGTVTDKSLEILENGDVLPEESLVATPLRNQDDIGFDRAKEIAVTNAGIQLADATFTKAEQDYDDGVSVYELEFYTAEAEYEYEINAATGEILDSQAEWFRSTASDGTGNSLSYIGVDQAKEIALGHAHCAASDVVFTKAKLEKDDGCTLYEIEFCHGGDEYEYCIEAFTGSIMDWEYDCNNDCDNTHHSGHHDDSHH